MSERSASLSSRSEVRTAAALGAALFLGAVLFLGSWALLHVGFYRHDQVVDTPVYQKYGDWMASGKVPYRDFGVEYPPGALPAFVLPSLADGHGRSYRDVFELLMMACGVALVGFVTLCVRALRAPPADPLLFVAAAWLLLGSVVLTRFDLYPAALTAAALAALLSGRWRLGAAVLGLATAVKLYPAVILPLALAAAWRQRGRRECLLVLGAFALAFCAVVLPFVVLSPGGVWDGFTRQTSRPLQIESLGSGFLLAAHQAFGHAITMESGHGSQNLVGRGADALAAVQSLVQAGAMVALWVAFARGPASPRRLARYAAAVVVAFVALGKVLSPQFLIWLVPLVPLAGRRLATGLLALALLLTQLWFPFRYWDLALHFDPWASWLVLARDLALVAVLVALARPLRTRIE
jgi:hypothetical protein